jgi:hypothetical protein
VVEHVDAVELRVVVAAVLAVAADAVLVAQHRSSRSRRRCRARRTAPPKTRCPSGYRTGSPPCANLARRSNLEAGSTRKKKGGEERRNVKYFVCKFDTGNRKYRWHVRVYPEGKIH